MNNPIPAHIPDLARHLSDDPAAATRLCHRFIDATNETHESRPAVVAAALIAALGELNIDSHSLLNLLSTARAMVRRAAAQRQAEEDAA